MSKYIKEIHFRDYPDFKPNLSPKSIFKLGSFGGTYWRPIHSSVLNEDLKDQHLKYKWDIDESLLSCSNYDESKNYFGVSCGLSLEYWEAKGWIKPQDPYGWVQWYCEFYNGRRSEDDIRQIKRWKSFISRMKGMIKPNKENKKIRQSLLHWGLLII